MKWRKQMTNMWDDERVARLVGSGGQEGLAAFGMYCRVLDIVAGHMDGKSDVCSVTYPVSRWSQLLVTRGSLVFSGLSRLAVTHLVTVERHDSEVTVTIPKLLKYRDEYSSKSGQTPHKEQNRTEQIQNNTLAAPTVAEMKLSGTLQAKTPTEETADWFEAELWPLWVKAANDSKAAALKSARTKAKTATIREEILSGVKLQASERLSREPQFRSHCSTWLNQERWRDCAVEPQPQVSNGLFSQSNGKLHDPSNTEYKD